MFSKKKSEFSENRKSKNRKITFFSEKKWTKKIKKIFFSKIKIFKINFLRDEKIFFDDFFRELEFCSTFDSRRSYHDWSATNLSNRSATAFLII